MGKTSKSGLGMGVGLSPQGNITQSSFDIKVKELISNEPKQFNSSNFDFKKSEPKDDEYLLKLNHVDSDTKAKFLKDVFGYEKGDGKKINSAIGQSIDGRIFVMEELDCVKLIKPFKNLKVGTKGTIVRKYTENDFEVEFFDDNHETIDVYTITGDYLQIYWKYSKSKDN